MAQWNLKPDPSYAANRYPCRCVQVVNQAPMPRTALPTNIKRCPVLIISVLKCIVGVMQGTLGVINIFLVPHYTSWIDIPVGCGILFLINGIIGICTYRSPQGCLVGIFLGLSIASLVFSVIMLGFFSSALAYFVKAMSFYLTSGFYNCIECSFGSYRVSQLTLELSLGLIGSLMFLIFCELSLSIAALVYSCKVYSKCCNTCDTKDCCTFYCCCDFGANPYARHHEVSSALPYIAPQHAYTLQALKSLRPRSSLVNVSLNVSGAHIDPSIASINEAGGAVANSFAHSQP